MPKKSNTRIWIEIDLNKEPVSKKFENYFFFSFQIAYKIKIRSDSYIYSWYLHAWILWCSRLNFIWVTNFHIYWIRFANNKSWQAVALSSSYFVSMHFLMCCVHTTHKLVSCIPLRSLERILLGFPLFFIVSASFYRIPWFTWRSRE